MYARTRPLLPDSRYRDAPCGESRPVFPTRPDATRSTPSAHPCRPDTSTRAAPHAHPIPDARRRGDTHGRVDRRTAVADPVDAGAGVRRRGDPHPGARPVVHHPRHRHRDGDGARGLHGGGDPPVGTESYAHTADTFTNDPASAVQWPFTVGVPISSTFGYRTPPCPSCSNFHAGLDMTPGIGTPIQAIADGVVTTATGLCQAS
ncbi:hypothetical protein GCM10009724_25390 [Microbacterium lacticum]|nr:hypothetical protein GCM10009724_25390 [Microbacterium lacticum]